MSNTGALPLTYPDLVCLDDMDPFASETTSDLQNLWQDVYHVLLQDPGSNPDDVDRGLGVVNLLSGDTSVLATLPRTAEQELLKDDRIDAVKIALVQIPVGGTLSNGTVLDGGGYELLVQIQPSGAVLPQSRSFGYANGGGLVPL